MPEPSPLFSTIGVGLSTSCRNGSSGSTAPLKKPLSFTTVSAFSSLSGDPSVLTVVNQDGSLTDLFKVAYLDKRQVVKIPGVTNAIAVSNGDTNFGPGLRAASSGRIALLKDGGIALIDFGQPIKTFAGTEVKRALGGKSIRQYEGDMALLTDGTVESKLIDRLNGIKLEESPVLKGNDNKPLKRVSRLKTPMLLMEDGTLLNTPPLPKPNKIIDAKMIEVEGEGMGMAIVPVVCADGSVWIGQPDGTFKALSGMPKDVVRLETFPEKGRRTDPLPWSTVFMTRSGEVWQTDLKAEQPPFAVRGLNQIVDIAVCQSGDVAVALRQDGTVWAWHLRVKPETISPKRIAENVLLPDKM